jgi:hypothetical protein
LFSEKAARLVNMPSMGRPGRLAGTRELVAHRHYILIYDVADDSVRVLRVLGGRGAIGQGSQLNLSEGRHSLAREVFHGKRGELFQRYREGQEDQLSALGLVVNMIVLWNTLYMDAVLAQLRSEGYPVRPEDEARLSPFGHEHINMLGRYSFSVPEAVARGELRPLNSGRGYSLN